MRSHAQLPTPLHLERNLYRVYFASRDDRNRSHVGWFDVELGDVPTVVGASSEPVLEPGPLGGFDDHGVYASSVLRSGDEVLLYTIGWSPGARPPLFYANIGLARSRDGGRTFEKHGRVPIFGRNEQDPLLVTAPWVLRQGQIWRMWYVSGHEWRESDDGLASVYDVKHARSEDGLRWQPGDRPSLALAPGESNISRACVLSVDGGFVAWFGRTATAGSYSLDAAWSEDGLSWERQPRGVELPPAGASDFDSSSRSYPAVVVAGHRLFLFYNGDGLGRAGVGLASAELPRSWPLIGELVAG